MMRVGWREHAIGCAFAVTYVAALLATANDLAMSRDESFYVVAAERYGEWISLAWEDFGAASEQGVIDRYWSNNHEHPALMKSLFALSSLAQEKWEIFDTPTKAHRFPGMVTGGLLVWLVLVFGARAYGRTAGVFAALAFAALPRVFYHAHLNCFDVPIALMLTWVTYCYYRSLDDWRWAIWTGVAYGFALATKHNAWILPGILLVHFLFVVWRERARRRAGHAKRVSYVPWWLVAMAAIGPLLFLGSWPWLWNDTVARFSDYASFHLNHEYYNMAYFGRNYFLPPFPVGYPWVMTLYTVPLVTVVLALLGVGLRARALFPAKLDRRFWPRGKVRADRRCVDVLFIGSLLAPLLVISLPSTPIFGGTKHWFPAYPFLALFAGVAFAKVGRIAVRFAKEWKVPRANVLAPLAAGALVLAAPFVETAHAHPFGLSFYSFAAGGVPGAADDGMNRQFWGFTQGSLAPWLRETMPNGGTVWICDATHIAWTMMQRDGMIPDTIRAVGQMTTADYVLVHHEHHFAEVDFQAWVAFGSVKPVHVLTYDGVPIISVYENPRR
jgi:4-amino-4-deoxy-L-arabinose transferase-like glycosyltransferase